MLICKTLALSKINFQAFMTPIPIYVVTEQEKIQKSFLWKNSTSKIKHNTLFNDYNSLLLMDKKDYMMTGFMNGKFYLFT